MIRLNLNHTELLDNGLRFSPEYGVLLAPPSRLKLDPGQPRRVIVEEDLKSLRADIDDWRTKKHGLLGSGIMEPLKCRWAPGSMGKDGRVLKAAKLLIWDGGRKFRVTKDDYEWLPIILDDLSAKEARSAALRTSIHNKHHLPIEQAHAFEAEMRDENLSLRAMAKKYNVDKSYIENRVNLLKCPPDVQQFAAAHPDLMSHALTMRPITDKELRTELMEYAKHGAPVRELQAVIAEAARQHELEKESQRAPDSETQSRQSRANEQGSAPMSRGQQITTHNRREANEAAKSAATMAGSNLDTVAQWVDRGATIPRNELLTLQHKIKELLGKAVGNIKE